MGLAALLPGMQYAVELMQRQLDDMRAQLAALQNEGAPATHRRGRPPNKPLPVAETGELNARGKPLKKSYWANMTAEERSAEARRRREVQRVNTAKKLRMHPRDPRHPEHDAWIAKMRKAGKKKWASMSPGQRKARLATMAAGKKPHVKMEAA